jgi:hypothetical protein
MTEDPQPEPSEADQRQLLYDTLGKVEGFVTRHRAAKPGTPVLGSPLRARAETVSSATTRRKNWMGTVRGSEG